MKRTVYGLHVHASSEQFAAIHDTIRPRGHGSCRVKLRIVLPELEIALELEDFFDHFQHLGGRDIARVGDIVDAEGDFLKPAVEAGLHIVAAVRERIEIVVDLGVALDLGEVVAVVVELIEGNPQPPDVVLPHPLNHLFPQCLGTAVEAAG